MSYVMLMIYICIIFYYNKLISVFYYSFFTDFLRVLNFVCTMNIILTSKSCEKLVKKKEGKKLTFISYTFHSW